MSKRKELTEVHPAIDKILEKHKPNVRWHKNVPGIVGGEAHEPDYTIIAYGWAIGLEAKWDMWNEKKNGELVLSKAKDRLPTPGQTKKLREIEEAGGMGLVVDRRSLEKFKELLDHIKLFNLSAPAVIEHAQDLGVHYEKYGQSLPEIKI